MTGNGVETVPLRIGVVTNELQLTGGVERCVLEDTRELVSAGHHVEVWYRDSRPGITDAGSAELANGDEPYDRLRVPRFRTEDRSFSPRTMVSDLRRFVRDGLQVRRSRLDVLWLNRPEHIVWGRIVSMVAGVPLVVHLHHAPNYRHLRPFSGGRTHFLAVSHTMARAWAAVGVPRDRITVVPNGIDTSAFPVTTVDGQARARRVLGLDEHRPTVLYYGRLSVAKGVPALLGAWRRVALGAALHERPGSGSDAPASDRSPVLVLAGLSVREDAELVQRTVDAMPEGSVVVLPPRDDVLPLLHAADLVVMPSMLPEGFGRVVVESMAAGRPVIATDNGGTAEILGDEWSWATVDPADRVALADKLVEGLDRVRHEPSIGDRARAYVHDRYGRDVHVARLLAALYRHTGH
ncbi:glycosyltransferase family 4 protein [Curtobacterium pusillum]|uniref:glycosyltransferase family 4 protein n=1 Tax=Curtobacterium pusillum TaxID=69373 RepID=UPI001643F1A4|nr:glycosyltransferase family 4 protein [Curtobacterium pusillum]